MFKHFNSENIASNVIYRIHEDIEGLIWLGTGRGVSTYDKDKNIFTNYSFDPKDSNSVPDNFVASIAEVPDGSGIWFGTGGGACFWDRSSRRMKRLQKPQTLAGILTIYCQSRDDVWFGMEDRGLIRLFHDSITIYDKSMGLTSNSVYGVLPDSQGYLWLGTGLGLIKFDPKTGRSVVFNTGDGLMDDEFNQGAFLKTKRGELFFGGSHGVCSFFPDRIQNNQFVPPIAITSFKVFNQEIRSNFLEGDIVELPYNDNVFSFEFSALAYNNSAKNSYAYTMENFESQWNYVGQRRFAAYTNLDPGTYTFRVKGTNNDGIWNEKGTSIRMVIHPPFWRTWWFRLLIFIAVVGVLWTFYRLWEKRLLEIERLRVRIAGDLHDDVGATLTKISLYSELIRGGMDKHNHDSFLANINSMSREVITTMSDIVWSIDARNDFSDSLITHMRDFAYDLLTPKSIKIQFHIEGVEPQKVRSAFRQSVYLIFKESVNNIAKHADATEVTIHLQRQKQLFHMTIHDNGKGFDPERAKKGHGLRNLAMRAKQINGQLTIAESNGTKIELVVPWK